MVDGPKGGDDYVIREGVNGVDVSDEQKFSKNDFLMNESDR